MKIKLLRLEEYNHYFYFNKPETGCGIELDRESGDNYFYIQTFFPKSYFGIGPITFLANPFAKESDVPEQVQIKFELFGIGMADKTRVFAFKPWIINIDNPIVLRMLEDFLLFIPEKLFFNLILRLLFLEQFNIEQLQKVRVFEDIREEEFIQFGIHRYSIPPNFETTRYIVADITDDDAQNEIERFYTDNEFKIEEHLTNKYFRHSLNKWYEIKGKDDTRTYGYIRLYNTNSSFTGGMLLEYIVSKKERNKGVATEVIMDLLNFLEQYSFAFTIGAEVNNDNYASIKVLQKCNFLVQKSGSTMINGNYNFNLIRQCATILESEHDAGNLEFRMDSSYADDFSRYYS